jgi:hypothetical protein
MQTRLEEGPAPEYTAFARCILVLRLVMVDNEGDERMRVMK